MITLHTCTGPRRLGRTAVAVAALLGAGGVQALDFNINYVGINGVQQTAFEQATAIWSSLLSDAITVNLQVGFASLGSSVLGQASTSFTFVSYADLRGALAADASSVVDSSAVASLSLTDPSFMAATGPGTTAMVTQSEFALTLANARALGLSTSGAFDATITFSSDFSWDYDRSDGTGGSFYDFVTVAAHELGHSLGFVSGVDSALDCLNNQPCDVSQERFAVLDLFRYSAVGVNDVRPEIASYLSVDGGLTSEAGFEDGSLYQASHFLQGGGTYLMGPTVAAGVQRDPGMVDLVAMDAIGWNLAAPVPEPTTWAMMLLGLGGLGAMARRRG